MRWRDRVPDGLFAEGSVLPFGNGRSYGDSCLNSAGYLLDARGLDRFIRFDPVEGTLACEAGVLLSEILDLVVPRGWFLPVTPGTAHVTVGGAIANDVHGKNHHRTGTFGCHVRRLELLRSEGTRHLCSRTENADLFRATVGGLGLTGLILWAELSLRPVASEAMEVRTTRFGNLEEFAALSAQADQDHEYTVAWVDCLARGDSLGRGLFMAGDHAAGNSVPRIKPRLDMPVDPPFPLVNGLSLRLFNLLYYHRPVSRGLHRQHYRDFLYPLDRISRWNRMYGRRGFMQYQCVVPRKSGTDVIGELLGQISASGTGSFLTVLKVFGDIESPGTLSFPRPGLTLALDFPNRGKRTLDLLDDLDRVVVDAGGAVYPAKDARMSSNAFKSYFPRWLEFEEFVDPGFSSDLWRRVAGGGG